MTPGSKRLTPVVLLILAAAACGSADDPASAKGRGDGERPGAESPSSGTGDKAAGLPAPTSPGSMAAADPASGGGAAAPPSLSVPAPGPSPSPTPPMTSPGKPVTAGTLTAGVWDDNRNFDWFTKYTQKVSQTAAAQAALGFTPEEQRAAQQEAVDANGPRAKLDIALVIDTTGSMSDEIRYLQAEFTSISKSIQAQYPDAEQRWSLVVYRDTQDEYVVRWFDFRADSEEFRTKLSAQQANGGGDYEEASDEGLAAMNKLSWRAGADVARLAFWVADAPHHTAKAAALTAAVRDARRAGIHLYPVASSGVDERTELTMRSAAQLTGGRYIFLTDDSGVGGAHKEPTIPCYFVTRLSDALLRMVDVEMTGVHREPRAEEVLRTSGDLQEGACRLESGDVLAAF